MSLLYLSLSLSLALSPWISSLQPPPTPTRTQPTLLMRIHVHVREKVIRVECGSGTQKIDWLGNVGVTRYDHSHGMSLGRPLGIRQEGGSMYNPRALVRNELKAEQHVFVVLKGDFEV